jgi:hypothetical protein
MLRKLSLHWPFLVVVTLTANLAHGQCASCVKIGQCGNSNSGGCLCIMSGNGFCQRCGVCVAGACTTPCEDPNTSKRNDGSKSGPDRELMPPSHEQLAAHPWISDDKLPALIAPYSPAIGHLLKEEQQVLRAKWCTNFVRGNMAIIPGDESTAYKWEWILQDGADEFRVKRLSDGDEQRIIVTHTRWIIYRGDELDNVVAKGDL